MFSKRQLRLVRKIKGEGNERTLHNSVSYTMLLSLRSELEKQTEGDPEEAQLTSQYGGVAQLGEHLPCKQRVKGSNPFISTTGYKLDTNRAKLKPQGRSSANQ